MSSWTTHARQRAAQRAIPEFHVELLHAFGEVIEQRGGSVVLRLASKRRELLRRQLADVLAHWDQLQHAYVVIAPEGQVITVAYPHNRSRRRRSRRIRVQHAPILRKL